MTKSEFQKMHQQYTLKEQELIRKNNILSVLRFCFMFCFVFGLLIGYFQKIYILYIIAFVCLLLFFVFIHFHHNIKKQLVYVHSKNMVFEEHLQRIQGQWKSFQDDGSEWVKEKDYKAYDLDILSKSSLYQMMNVAFTYQGRKRLADTLMCDDVTDQTIIERQNAVGDLANREKFVLELQTFSKMIPKQNEQVIEEFIFDKQEYKKIPSYFFIFPICTLVSLIGLLINTHPYIRLAFEIGVVAQLCISFICMHMHQRLFEPILQFNKGLGYYQKIFEIIENETFESPQLQHLQSRMCVEGKVVKAIQQLSIIADRVNYRKNIFAFLILNGLFSFDLLMRNTYIEWLNQYHQHIQDWFDGLSELEVLMSLCILKIDDFKVTMPQIVHNQTLIFHNLRHPLIPDEKVVGNDFEMSHPVCIITGSNMSGKTTFMRTIGLNLVLAYSGGYVFADDMKCSPMHMMTSMRVKDNVEEGISTFYGELLRIKDMVQYVSHQKPMICLIDEIFKGTNSLDRFAGAKATIEKLSLPYVMTFLTTHDVELCKLTSISMSLYHFEEYYKDSRIYFDYIIKEGSSKTTNGQFLLKQLGIIDEKK